MMNKNHFLMIFGVMIFEFILIISYTKVYGQQSDLNNINQSDSIPVGKGPSGLAIDPDTHKVYVANYDSNTVSVIDGTTNNLLAGIRFSISPKPIPDI